MNVAFVPAQTVLLAGCVVITGNWPSFTVTVNVHVEVLPHASVAVEVTVVVPIGNAEPDAGELTIVTAPPQLSVAVGVKFTTAEQEPTGVVTVIFAGQVMVGTAFTVTVAVIGAPTQPVAVTVGVMVKVTVGEGIIMAN
mgnify:CR=1 FL=1